MSDKNTNFIDWWWLLVELLFGLIFIVSLLAGVSMVALSVFNLIFP